MIKLSKRLLAAASLVTEGNILADVGTDHGYVPIYLLEQKKIPRAIAMDINKGPLQRAQEHIRLYEMGDYIETPDGKKIEGLGIVGFYAKRTIPKRNNSLFLGKFRHAPDF